MEKIFYDTIFKLYLYGDMCKMIHYTTKSHHIHKLCDETREDIQDFADSLAEQSFGYLGKPKFNDLSLKHSIKETNDLSQLCKYVIKLVLIIRKRCKNNKNMQNILSTIDDFTGKMYNNIYLCSFDKNKQMNESIDKIIDKTINKINKKF